MAAQRHDVGRMIFGRDNRNGPTWLALTLRSHTENVVLLAESWDTVQAYFHTGHLDLEASRTKLLKAARIHDAAKPRKFKIQFRKNNFADNVWQWVYSFAGHRFEVFDPDPYVQSLVRLHHEYSVEGITKAIAELRIQNISYAGNLPLDLYTLEMCDQIEATAANVALGGSPDERVFMDFHIEALSSGRLALDPFPFRQAEIPLSIEYALLKPPADKVGETETNRNDTRSQIESELRDWVVRELQSANLQTSEVILCPLVKA